MSRNNNSRSNQSPNQQQQPPTAPPAAPILRTPAPPPQIPGAAAANNNNNSTAAYYNNYFYQQQQQRYDPVGMGNQIITGGAGPVTVPGFGAGGGVGGGGSTGQPTVGSVPPPPPPPSAVGGYAAALARQQQLRPQGQQQLQAPPPPPPIAKTVVSTTTAPPTAPSAVSTVKKANLPPPPPTTTRGGVVSSLGPQYHLQQFNPSSAASVQIPRPVGENRPPPPAPPPLHGAGGVAQTAYQQHPPPAPAPPPPLPFVPSSTAASDTSGMRSLPSQVGSSGGAASTRTEDSDSKRGKRGREDIDVDHSDDNADHKRKAEKEKKRKEKKEKKDKRGKDRHGKEDVHAGERTTNKDVDHSPALNPIKTGSSPVNTNSEWVVDTLPKNGGGDGLRNNTVADRLSGKMSFADSHLSLKPAAEDQKQRANDKAANQEQKGGKEGPAKLPPTKSPVKQPHAKLIGRISPIPAKKSPPPPPAARSSVLPGVPAGAITVPKKQENGQKDLSNNNSKAPPPPEPSTAAVQKVSDALGNSFWRYNPTASAPGILKSSSNSGTGGVSSTTKKKSAGTATGARRCVFTVGTKFNKRFTTRYTCVDESFGTQPKTTTTTTTAANRTAPRGPSGAKIAVPSAGRQNDTKSQQQALAKRKPGTFINEEFSDMRMRQFVSEGADTVVVDFWTQRSIPSSHTDGWISRVKGDRANKRNVKDIRRLPEKDGLSNKGSDLLGLWIPGGTVSVKTYLGVPFFKKSETGITMIGAEEQGDDEEEADEIKKEEDEIQGGGKEEEGDEVPPLLNSTIDIQDCEAPSSAPTAAVVVEEAVDPATIDATLVVEGARGLVDVRDSGDQSEAAGPTTGSSAGTAEDSNRPDGSSGEVGTMEQVKMVETPVDATGDNGASEDRAPELVKKDDDEEKELSVPPALANE